MNNQVRKKVSKLVYTYGIYLPTFFYSWIKPTFTNFYQLPTLVNKDKKNALLLPFARLYPLETGNYQLSLQFLGLFLAILGLKVIDNKSLWLRNNYDNCSYRNHRIKNHLYNRFSVFEDSKTYHQKRGDNVLIIMKTYTKGIFSMIKQCQNFNKFRSKSI